MILLSFVFILSNYTFFQNAGVKMTSTVNISRRPTSIRNEHIHLSNHGNDIHDIVGPISEPSAGPTLPILLSAMVIASVLFTPETIMEKELTMISITYILRKANSVTRLSIGLFTPSIFNGRTAFGCIIFLNSLRVILRTILARMHLNPPAVLPAIPPINIHSARITHVM